MAATTTPITTTTTTAAATIRRVEVPPVPPPEEDAVEDVIDDAEVGVDETDVEVVVVVAETGTRAENCALWRLAFMWNQPFGNGSQPVQWVVLYAKILSG